MRPLIVFPLIDRRTVHFYLYQLWFQVEEVTIEQPFEPEQVKMLFHTFHVLLADPCHGDHPLPVCIIYFSDNAFESLVLDKARIVPPSASP